MQRSDNQGKLVFAGVLFILAGLALAIDSPEGLNGVNRQPNFMGVLELAEKIKNREEVLIVDLRDSASFNQFHIPTAKNVPLDFLDFGSIEEGMIFCSGDDLLTRRLWDSLPDTLRDHSIILYGGVRDWYDRLLYPTLPYGDTVDEPELLKRIHSLCEFYGGFADFEADP